MAINKKLIHFKTFNNFNSKKLSANEANTQYTLGVSGEIQEGTPDILYQSIVYIKDTKQQWTHGLLYTSDDNYFETKVESQNKLQEAKDYTDSKIAELQEDVVIQTIELTEGWNWVSFYVEITLEKLQNALGTNGIEIKYMDFTTSYDEELGLWLSAGNPLTSIEPSKMYMINTNSNCVIELEGKLLEDVEITLNQGENYISYPLNQEVDINTALQNLDATQGDNIKGYGTTLIATYYNGKWVGPLATLKPGQGYLYTSNSTETIIFKYPNNLDLKLSDYTTKEYVNEEINLINTKIDSFHNKTAIQTIELTEGWNSVSFYVDITLEQLLEALGNNALLIKDEIARKYILYSQTSGWYGTLKELVAGRYYGINIASNCKILLIGTLLNSNEITYSIGSGYSYIGYPLNHKLNINTAFKSIEPQEGDYLSTCINGETLIISLYSEGVWNGVQQLIPGQGYTYYSNADTNKHFTYPSVEIDFLSFVTEDDLKSKLQEAKDYTDIKTDELRDVVTQTLSLSVVGSTWCSFYVDITLEQLQQALGTNAASITTSYDGGETKIESIYNADTNTWSGDLTTLDVTKMYKIYINTECEISLTGRKIPNSIRYILNPGWNWIGYPSNNANVDINVALNNLTPAAGDRIKTQNNDFAEFAFGKWMGALRQLVPGQGYEYYNASTEPKTLVFITELIDTKSELNKKQNVLVSGTNIKTINGESLLGEGDIVISGGSNSSGGAYALVEHGTNDTTYTLTPNTFHVWGEVDSLTLTLGEEQSGVANEFLFQFESDETATTLTLPDDLIWANDDTPVIESNYTYQVSILNGFASIMKFKKPIIMISFTIDGITYQAEEGMTWGNWINTGYNKTSYMILNNNIINNAICVATQDNNLVVINDTIISNYNYIGIFQGGTGN